MAAFPGGAVPIRPPGAWGGAGVGGGRTGGRTLAHDVTSDTKHASHAEAVATYNDGQFKGTNRHVICLDCHKPHEAGAVLHAQGTNTVAADATQDKTKW